MLRSLYDGKDRRLKSEGRISPRYAVERMNGIKQGAVAKVRKDLSNSPWKEYAPKGGGAHSVSRLRDLFLCGLGAGGRGFRSILCYLSFRPGPELHMLTDNTYS